MLTAECCYHLLEADPAGAAPAAVNWCGGLFAGSGSPDDFTDCLSNLQKKQNINGPEN